MTRLRTWNRGGFPSETLLVKACLSLLRAKGIFAWRNNTGATKIGTRFIRFGTVGASDILGVLPDGRFLAVECKRPGNVVTAAQHAFQDSIQEANGVALVCFSVGELESALKRILAKNRIRCRIHEVPAGKGCPPDCGHVSHA